jgi:hypothetical protein
MGIRKKTVKFNPGVTPNLVGQSVPNQVVTSAPIDVEGYINRAYKSPGFNVPQVSSLADVKVAKETLPEVYQPNTSGVIKAQDLPKTEGDKIVGALEEQTKQAGRAQLALAGASFFADVLNANSAYATVQGQAQMNILQARNQAADAISRGRQAQLDAQSEGYQAGQSALLAMAAQGQDIQGAGVEKIQGSYEAMGIMNGMREEINSMREALGFKLEEVNYDYQVAQAGIGRKNAIIGSALNFAAAAGTSGVI